MNALITCEHVDFGYENVDAVVDVTMEIEPGDYLCIVGENGSEIGRASCRERVYVSV